jgi:hypothetical protein
MNPPVLILLGFFAVIFLARRALGSFWSITSGSSRRCPAA